MKKELNNFYFVKQGDTIDKISSLYNVNPVKILIVNNRSPLSLKEGDILFIPFS